MELIGPGRFTRGKEPRYPLLIGWVGPRAELDVLEKKQIFALDSIMTFFYAFVNGVEGNGRDLF